MVCFGMAPGAHHYTGVLAAKSQPDAAAICGTKTDIDTKSSRGKLMPRHDKCPHRRRHRPRNLVCLSLHALLFSSAMRSAQGFRFGGNGRDLLRLHDIGVNTIRVNRRQQNKHQKQNPVVSPSPAAATKSNGADETASSQPSPRRSRGSAGVDKPKNLPRRFPLRNIPLFDDGVESMSEKEDEVDPTTSTSARNLEEDESFHSIVNSMVEDIQQINSPASGKVSGEIELDDRDDSDTNDTGSAGRRPNGKRVTFFASKECSRTITLDGEYSRLLDEYMTLPLEQYSVKSFHDGGPNSKMEGRRWFLRRLDAEESAQYMGAYEPRDNHEDYMRNGGISGNDDGRFFRLAVPLAPLIGVELTPVIDLEVIPALKQPLSMEANGDVAGKDAALQTAPESHISMDEREVSELSPRPMRQPLRTVRRVLRRGRRNQQRNGESEDDSGDIDDIGEVGLVRVQSLRVSLLSTEDEVKALMKTRTRASKPIDKPTQVSQNPSVQQIGNEAIGVVGRVEQAIEPHITFDATITWDQHAESGPTVTVKSTAVTSLTIPKRAMAFRVPLPLPLGLLVRRIGSLLTKKALEITLPRFLRQLERDLERWARGGDGDER